MLVFLGKGSAAQSGQPVGPPTPPESGSGSGKTEERSPREAFFFGVGLGGGAQRSSNVANGGVALGFDGGYSLSPTFGLVLSGAGLAASSADGGSTSNLGVTFGAQVHLADFLRVSLGPGYYSLTEQSAEDENGERESESHGSPGGQLSLALELFRNATGSAAGLDVRGQVSFPEGELLLAGFGLLNWRWYGIGGQPDPAPPREKPAPRPGDVAITADNVYVAYVGSADGRRLVQLSPSPQGDWTILKFESLARAVSGDHLYIAAWDLGDVQMVTAEVTLRDGSILGTNARDWQSTALDLAPSGTAPELAILGSMLANASWSVPLASAPLGKPPWGSLSPLLPSTQFIWHDSFGTTATDGKIVVFRTVQPVR